MQPTLCNRAAGKNTFLHINILYLSFEGYLLKNIKCGHYCFFQLRAASKSCTLDNRRPKFASVWLNPNCSQTEWQTILLCRPMQMEMFCIDNTLNRTSVIWRLASLLFCLVKTVT